VTALQLYRDDGPLANFIGSRIGPAIRADELTLTLLAAVPLVAVLAASSRELPTSAIPAGVVAFVLLAGAAARRDHGRPLSWLVPPLLRAGEYAFFVTVTALSDPDAMPLCFAFLAVLVFHHYDAVYALRHRRAAVPSWVYAVGGGWDGRMLVASFLALAGVLDVGLLAGAVGLALVYVGETTSSSLRYARSGRAAVFDERDDELVE
jgi:Family of unknown function (DUF5941)